MLHSERSRSLLEPLIKQHEQQCAWWKAEVKAQHAQLESEWMERYSALESELQRRNNRIALLEGQVAHISSTKSACAYALGLLGPNAFW